MWPFQRIQNPVHGSREGRCCWKSQHTGWEPTAGSREMLSLGDGKHPQLILRGILPHLAPQTTNPTTWQVFPGEVRALLVGRAEFPPELPGSVPERGVAAGAGDAVPHGGGQIAAPVQVLDGAAPGLGLVHGALHAVLQALKVKAARKQVPRVRWKRRALSFLLRSHKIIGQSQTGQKPRQALQDHQLQLPSTGKVPSHPNHPRVLRSQQVECWMETPNDVSMEKQSCGAGGTGKTPGKWDELHMGKEIPEAQLHSGLESPPRVGSTIPSLALVPKCHMHFEYQINPTLAAG